MSDYPNPNLHRGDGVSGRGLLIAFGVIVAIIAILALVGSIGGVPDNGTVSQGAIAPAAEGVAIPAE